MTNSCEHNGLISAKPYCAIPPCAPTAPSTSPHTDADPPKTPNDKLLESPPITFDRSLPSDPRLHTPPLDESDDIKPSMSLLFFPHHLQNGTSRPLPGPLLPQPVVRSPRWMAKSRLFESIAKPLPYSLYSSHCLQNDLKLIGLNQPPGGCVQKLNAYRIAILPIADDDPLGLLQRIHRRDVPERDHKNISIAIPKLFFKAQARCADRLLLSPPMLTLLLFQCPDLRRYPRTPRLPL